LELPTFETRFIFGLQYKPLYFLFQVVLFSL